MKKRIIIEKFEEVLEREVKEFSNSSHITLPKKHIGKKAIIIIKG